MRAVLRATLAARRSALPTAAENSLHNPNSDVAMTQGKKLCVGLKFNGRIWEPTQKRSTAPVEWKDLNTSKECSKESQSCRLKEIDPHQDYKTL